MKPPEVVAEPGWSEFELPFEIGSGRSMFVTTQHGPTIRMRFFRRDADSALVGRVWFGQATFGPPGFVHGGLISYVADEAMGSAVWLAGYPCVAANIEVDFVEMTPIGQDCLVESRVVDAERRRIAAEASISLNDRTLVRTRGAFVRVKKDEFLAFSRAHSLPIPDLDRFDFAT